VLRKRGQKENLITLPVPRATVPQATQKQASEQIRRRVLAEFLIGHLLHGLLSCPVDLTAYPAILGVGVNAEFDGAVVGG
jgi:hypothetical protein